MKITPLRTNIEIYQGGVLDVRFIVYDDETGALADLRAVGVPDSGWLYYDVYVTGTGGDRWLIAYGQARVIPEYARPS